MSLFVLDTDTLVLFQEGHEVVCRRVLAHAMQELAISVITVEEQLSGWYTLLRRAEKSAENLSVAYQRLADSVELLSRFRILSFTIPAIDRFQQLKTHRLGVKHMDLRIAAISVEHAGTLVTRNTRDFQRVPGLTIEDWSA